MKILFILILALNVKFTFARIERVKPHSLLNSPVAFDPGMTNLLYGETIEYDVLKVLTGEQDTYSGHRIQERRTLAERQQTIQYLEAKLVELGYSPQRHEYKSDATNLWAVLEGSSSSNEYVVIGAHYDSVGNAGANDNASGVAVVMSLAKKLLEFQGRNKNVLIVFFDEEERGLVGSRNFASFLKASRFNIHSVHTIDQMAWDNDKDRAIELEKAPIDLMSVYQKVRSDRGYSMTLHSSSETSTDHTSFRNAGFKSMGLTEEYRNGDTTPCYHSKCDKFDTVDFEYLTSTANFWSDVIGYIITL